MEVWRSNIKMYIWHYMQVQTNDVQSVWATHNLQHMIYQRQQSPAKYFVEHLTTYLYLLLYFAHTWSHIFIFKSVACFTCCLPFTLLHTVVLKWNQTKAFKGQYLYWLSVCCLYEWVGRNLQGALKGSKVALLKESSRGRYISIYLPRAVCVRVIKYERTRKTNFKCVCACMYY